MGYMMINAAASLHLTLKILVYTKSLEDLCLLKGCYYQLTLTLFYF